MSHKDISSDEDQDQEQEQVDSEDDTVSMYDTDNEIITDIQEIEIHETPDNIEEQWKFVPLYKFDLNGNKRIWEITFDGEKLISTHGMVGGKLQHDPIDVVPKLKKTLGEQAYQEATNRYIKFIREGYQEAGATEPALFKVMKGNKYRDCSHKIQLWPVAVDPKLDGIRFLIQTRNGRTEGRTWTNIIYNHMDHIINDVAPLLDFLPAYATLDGELYIHGVPFYTISSIVRSDKNLHPNLKDLQYHIYDLAIENRSFDERKKMIVNAYKRFREMGHKSKHFSIVPSYIAYSEDDVMEIHEEIKKMGYEGSVIKKMANGTEEEYLREQTYYKFNKRCDNVLKLKDEDDDEFEIVDVITATGRDAGTGIFILKIKDGDDTFNCRPMGSIELRKEYLLNRKQLKGKMATVLYDGINEKTGKPRNPRMKEVRDYE